MWQFADLLFVCQVCLPFAAFRFADPKTSRYPKEIFGFAIVERAHEFAELRFADKKKYLRCSVPIGLIFYRERAL